MGDVDLFWAQVDKDGPIPDYRPDLGPCWLWTGTQGHNGYGLCHKNRTAYRAHRYAYEQLVGPIPQKRILDHLCRVRNCVNPTHLEPVTPKINSERGLWAMKTHCPKGHEYTFANTYRNPTSGHRYCRQCHREEEALRRQFKRIK